MENKAVAVGFIGFALIVSIALFLSFDNMNKRFDALTQAQYETGNQLYALTQQFGGQAGALEPAPSIPPQPEYETVDPSVFNLTNKVPRGNANASVMIVDFSDIGCPFSAKARDNLKQILIDYPNDVVLYFKHFPPHENAKEAHEGLECARLQGKFWEFHDIAFEKRANLTRDDLINYAGEIGLNKEEFAACIDSNETKVFLAADYLEADALGVDGTPFFFINGKPNPGYGDYASFKAMIQQALDETKK